MTKLEDRATAFEAKFRQDQEREFWVAARRNRLVGAWAAAKLGLPAGEATEAFAKTLVAADFEEPGDEDVKRKLRAEFASRNMALAEDELAERWKLATREAREQLG